MRRVWLKTTDGESYALHPALAPPTMTAASIAAEILRNGHPIVDVVWRGQYGQYVYVVKSHIVAFWEEGADAGS